MSSQGESRIWKREKNSGQIPWKLDPYPCLGCGYSIFSISLILEILTMVDLWTHQLPKLCVRMWLWWEFLAYWEKCPCMIGLFWSPCNNAGKGKGLLVVAYELARNVATPVALVASGHTWVSVTDEKLSIAGWSGEHAYGQSTRFFPRHIL